MHPYGAFHTECKAGLQGTKIATAATKNVFRYAKRLQIQNAFRFKAPLLAVSNCTVRHPLA